ncbi:hypothetical protein [Amaricoccus sp.]|uniref:hypothetical protein n=1 Tax=Amaricoccus sp. TaxID=1872485 RepID=UPI001B582FA8|nr:hypothetical protein [Amaricoccus sp.]MBP7000112.1 hypothetical protein [Amaricoccus sp.]
MTKKTLEERSEALGARIAAARALLERRERGDNETIGAVLGGLNDELDKVVHDDHDAAQQTMNKIEARLRAEEIRIEDDKEEEDR